jgi:hypothetical protein
MKITKSQLKSLIKEEVSRFKKIHILENRKKEIQRELRMLNENEGLGALYDSGLTDEEKFDKIMNTQEYLTQKEYDFCVNHAGADVVKSNMFYIGDYSSYGDYLNLNVYSEADKEADDFARETLGYGDLGHYADTGYTNPSDMYDSVEHDEDEKLKNQDAEFVNKYIRPHDSRKLSESKNITLK